MSDGQVSLNEVLQAAIDADNRGVPVDWKNMALNIYNVATNHIAQLQEQIPTPAEDEECPPE